MATLCPAIILNTTIRAELSKHNAWRSSATIPFQVFCICVGVLGAVGNSLVIFIFTRKTNKTSATYFILTLAGIDLAVCLTVIPFTVVHEAFVKYTWTDAVACKVFEWFKHASLSVSCLTLAFIAIDRYIAICHPLSVLVNQCRVKIIIVVSFLLGAGFQIQTLFFHGIRTTRVAEGLLGCRCDIQDIFYRAAEHVYFVSSLFACYLFLFVVIIVCYLRVWLTVRMRHINRQREQLGMTGRLTFTARLRRSQRHRKWGIDSVKDGRRCGFIVYCGCFRRRSVGPQQRQQEEEGEDREKSGDRVESLQLPPPFTSEAAQYEDTGHFQEKLAENNDSCVGDDAKEHEEADERPERSSQVKVAWHDDTMEISGDLNGLSPTQPSSITKRKLHQPPLERNTLNNDSGSRNTDDEDQTVLAVQGESWKPTTNSSVNDLQPNRLFSGEATVGQLDSNHPPNNGFQIIKRAQRQESLTFERLSLGDISKDPSADMISIMTNDSDEIKQIASTAAKTLTNFQLHAISRLESVRSVDFRNQFLPQIKELNLDNDRFPTVENIDIDKTGEINAPNDKKPFRKCLRWYFCCCCCAKTKRTSGDGLITKSGISANSKEATSPGRLLPIPFCCMKIKASRRKTEPRPLHMSQSMQAALNSFQQARYKTARLLLIVTIVFILSWFPFWVIIVRQYLDKQLWFRAGPAKLNALLIFRHFYFVNSMANPFVYAFLNQTFRNDLKSLLERCFRCRPKSSCCTRN